MKAIPNELYRVGLEDWSKQEVLDYGALEQAMGVRITWRREAENALENYGVGGEYSDEMGSGEVCSQAERVMQLLDALDVVTFGKFGQGEKS